MTLRKGILLFIGLAMIAGLVACSSSTSGSSTPPPTIAISATGGSNQSAQVGTAFGAQLQATVTSNNSPASGVTVTFAAPNQGASCTFANNTSTVTTNSSGQAVITCTANTEAGGPYNVTASTSGATTNATFILTNTAGPAADLVISSGNNQSGVAGGTYSALVAEVTDNDGNPISGISITFTITAGATGASGSFSGGASTETVSTDTNGNATVSDLVANSMLGGFTVTAAPNNVTLSPSSVTFNETNVQVNSGTYVYSLTGVDTDDYSQYYVVGAVTILNGQITGGEQDYRDIANMGIQDHIQPSPASVVTTTADGNLQLVLTTCLGTDCSQVDGVVGVNGVETLNVTLRPSNSNQGSILEFDSSGSGLGQWSMQNATAAATTPSAGYAFELSGFDGGEVSGDGNIYPLSMGGIINVDGAGTISGSGSIFDANDGYSANAYQGETFSTSGVSTPDLFGRVTFTLNPADTTDFPEIILVGYIVDSSQVSLIEAPDAYAGLLAGVAFSQAANTGLFSSASVNGDTLGVALSGFDGNGPMQTVAQVSFNSSATPPVGGFMDFNDLETAVPSPDPISALSFTVDSTGRVTIPGLTDGTNTINLQLYIDGNGNAVAITLDSSDLQGGTLGGQLNTTGVNDANFTGPYALTAWGWDVDENGTYGAVGRITATGSGDTFSGFTDINYFNASEATVPTANALNSGTYAVTANAGILSGSVTGLDIDSGFGNTDNFNYYQVNSSGECVAIETDTNQLTTLSFQP